MTKAERDLLRAVAVGVHALQLNSGLLRNIREAIEALDKETETK